MSNQKWENQLIFKSKSRRKHKSVKGNKRKSNRMKVIVRDGKKCSYCGADDIKLELDHIIPKSKGGSNELNNLVLSCRKCNLRKGNLLPYEIQDNELRERINYLRRYANSKSNWS